MLNHLYAVLHPFSYEVECYCSGEDNPHHNILNLRKGDVIEITDEGHHHPMNGWYMKALVKNRGFFYIYLNDLEDFVKQHKLLSYVDIELNLNHLNYQLDQALDQKDQAKFNMVVNKMNAFKRLKDQLEETQCV